MSTALAATSAEAGPSRHTPPLLKPAKKRPRASNADSTTSDTQVRSNRRKLQPPRPPKTPSSHPAATAKHNGPSASGPTLGQEKRSRLTAHGPDLPIKTIQGARTRRTDGTKDGYGREVVFVTRKMGLGALMGRCRSLVMDEGYTCLTLHALAAAIPHALLLLHALMDVLPYPRGERGMWYEIHTGSVECVDEVASSRSGTAMKLKGATSAEGEASSKSGDAPEGGKASDVEGVEDDLGLGDLDDIGGMEEDEPVREIRLKSSIQIQLHISPKRHSVPATNSKTSTADAKGPPKVGKGSRPSKAKRLAAREAASQAQGMQKDGAAVMVMDEEDMTNFV